MLANDPHLNPQSPNAFYFARNVIILAHNMVIYLGFLVIGFVPLTPKIVIA